MPRSAGFAFSQYTLRRLQCTLASARLCGGNRLNNAAFYRFLASSLEPMTTRTTTLGGQFTNGENVRTICRLKLAPVPGRGSSLNINSMRCRSPMSLMSVLSTSSATQACCHRSRQTVLGCDSGSSCDNSVFPSLECLPECARRTNRYGLVVCQ